MTAPPNSRLAIACAQGEVTGDIAANGETIRTLISEAHTAGARLVQFTEGALSGYTRHQVADWQALDRQVLRREIEETASLCGALGIWAVVGSGHPLTPPNRPHNSLYVFSDIGQLLTRYDKRLCSYNEINNLFSPGFDPIVFEVDGFRFGLALCIEVAFPAVFAEYEALGVDAVLLSSYGLRGIERVQAQAHAGTNCIWIGVAIPSELAGQGPAGVIAPNGQWISQAVGRLSIAVLDRTDAILDIALSKARPWRRIASEGGIYRQRRVEDPRSASRRLP